MMTPTPPLRQPFRLFLLICHAATDATMIAALLHAFHTLTRRYAYAALRRRFRHDFRRHAADIFAAGFIFFFFFCRRRQRRADAIC